MIDREKLVVVASEIKRLIGALEELPQPIIGGRAAALGTLTAIHRRFEALATALESREATAADRADVVNAVSSLTWLSEDKLVLSGLPDDVALEGFDSYSSAICDLISKAQEPVG